MLPEHASTFVTLAEQVKQAVNAQMALHDARNELAEHEELVIESILGEASTPSGRIVGRTQIGSYPAVIPRITGHPFLTGYHELLIDPRDALGLGFLVEG